ncbi:MAG: cytochrome d ubiquinol oxidase subunit II [Magnetospirillum sp.]|nr:cytochrome d ubiquinol oxidase subunit II [Magnetospirillum sp.]
MAVPIPYEILRLAWWLLLGLVLIGFAVMDGFDLGVAILLPFVARGDVERRVVINSIGPVWDGNQVWLILGGGAAFAAFPPLYAAAFSGFYIPLLLVLAALILRPVGFDFRNKVASPVWRLGWDVALFLGGLVPTLVFGVAIGNLLLGVPFRLSEELRPIYTGGALFDLLTPFPLLVGLVSLAMLVMHGAAYLGLKTEGAVERRSRLAVYGGAAAVIVLFSLAGWLVATAIDGYAVVAAPPHDAPSNPLTKEVVLRAGAWLENYRIHPWMIAGPALGYAGSLAAAGFTVLGRRGLAFLGSAAAVFGIVSTAGLSLFPFLLPSRDVPSDSLTLWDASSSQLTLFIMLVATVVVLPIVASYTVFVYRTLRGKVTAGHIERHGQSMY